MKSGQITIAIIILILIEIKLKGIEAACGVRIVSHGPLITNGFPSNEGDWPWHAHCVYENNRPIIPERVSVQLGRYNLKVFGTNTQDFEVFNIIPHPSYNTSDLSNDIAIIRLATKATLNNYVQPICLSKKLNIEGITGKIGTVIGWGVTENGLITNILRQAFMPVVSSLMCLQSDRLFFGSYLSNKNFCAGFRNGTSVCDGDSGGSMTFEENGVYYLGGIVSLAKSRMDKRSCNTKEYVIFTHVASYLSWIEKLLRELPLPAEVASRSSQDLPKKVLTSETDFPAFRLAASTDVFWRQIKLYINDAEKVAYAEISNGDPTDEVWMDLSFDGGSSFDQNLGRAAIPSCIRSVRTAYVSLQNGTRDGVLRAGGKAGNRDDVALTSWEGAQTMENVVPSKVFRLASSAEVFWRKIKLYIDDGDKTAYAEISSGDPTDEVWMDISFDGGRTFAENIGRAAIPFGYRAVNTTYFSLQKSGGDGVLRAGGKAGNRDDVALTSWEGARGVGNVVLSKVFRLAASAEVFSRQIRLYIDDADKTAFAEISNGDPTDEVWMDVSFDGGSSFAGNIGRAAIASGFRAVNTSYFSLQNSERDGVLRAGGKAGNRDEVALTSWEGVGNVVLSKAFRLAASTEVFWRQIKLYINDAEKVAYAEISNGDPTDEVWMDLSFDGGSSFDENLGRAAIPSGNRSVRSTYVSLQNGTRDGVSRAGGKAGNRNDVALTSWEGAQSMENIVPTKVFRLATSAAVFSRQIKLYIDDADKTAYAEISNGDPTDEVWMDISFDGGSTFAENIGRAAIPFGYRAVNTTYFSLQKRGRDGVLRAGGKAGNRDEVALTSWEGAHGIGNVVLAKVFRLAASAAVFSRQIKLYINDADKTAYAEISNGDPTDEVWMDISLDGGSSFAGNIGRAAIASGFRAVNTSYFSLQNSERDGVLRAGGKAGNRDEVALTSWEGVGYIVLSKAFRLAASTEVFWRQIKLYINDAEKMAYAEISNGDPTDEVWMDLSFDGGSSFDENLGRAAIPSGNRSVRTIYISLQNGTRHAVLRAGGKAGNRDDVALTSWEGAHVFRLAASATVFSRQIRLYMNDADKTAYAEISNGDPTDEVWMDISFDGGSSIAGNIGRAAIASGFRAVNTSYFSLQNSERDGVLRAGGKAGNRDEVALTSWEGIGNVVLSKAFRLAASTEIFWRQIKLYINDAEKMAYAEISNGDPTDEVWMDLSFDGGSSFDENLGRAAIPSGNRSVRTTYFNLQNGTRHGVLRAGGKAGNREDVAHTSWEGANGMEKVVPSKVFRLAGSAEVYWRRIRLYINDADKTAYAEISNGDPTDEVWMDISFDGGSTFAENIGRAAIPSGYRAVNTTHFSLQNSGRDGVLRAGGKAGNRDEVALTSWEGAHGIGNVVLSKVFRLAASATLFSRQIRLYMNDADKTAYAEISNGDPTDEVWMDVSFDGGSSIAGNIGRAAIASGLRAVNTSYFSLQNSERDGVLRAGGKAGNRDEVALTSWEGIGNVVLPKSKFLT